MGALPLPDGRALSWFVDGTLWVWDLETGRGHALEDDGGRNVDALLLPDGRPLSWSDDATLRLWDLETSQGGACGYGDDPFTTCTVDQEGKIAIVGDSRGRVLFFDLPEKT